MKTLAIEITLSARRYGYIIWPPRMQEEVESFLNSASKVHLYFRGDSHGRKNVDWKYRRISLGATVTNSIPLNMSTFVLTRKEENSDKLFVECQ